MGRSWKEQLEDEKSIHDLLLCFAANADDKFLEQNKMSYRPSLKSGRRSVEEHASKAG